MNNDITVFDILVVYTDNIAQSASTKQTENLPFLESSQKSNYNNAYAYFLSTCKKRGLKAAFTTTKDLTTKGYFKSYWLFENNSWKKISKKCVAPNIFDKFAPINKKQKTRRSRLFRERSITPFSSPEMYWLFFDKQKTFDYFSDYTIPTVSVKQPNDQGIITAIENLTKLLALHPNKKDFSTEFIVKDRFGSSGDSVYKVKALDSHNSISKILSNERKKTFILQPFVKFDNGYKLGRFKGFVDIRIVYMGKKMIQAYIRTPKENDFKCNEHQGGSLEYISIRQIPKRVITLSQKVAQHLDYKTSLFALDFIISNNGNVYLMEGNCAPGIDWNLANKINERRSKKLIREIVKELGIRSGIEILPFVPLREKIKTSMQQAVLAVV